MITARLSPHQIFLDRPAVERALGPRFAKAYRAWGATARRHAQRSIVIRPYASRPGQPPHGHTTGTVIRKSRSRGTVRIRRVSLLREHILFAYDTHTRSVVVGPVPLRGTVHPPSVQALEYGGPSVTLRDGRRHHVVIAPRPYMRPAADAANLTLPALLKV
jgi:hypothetical protein